MGPQSYFISRKYPLKCKVPAYLKYKKASQNLSQMAALPVKSITLVFDSRDLQRNKLRDNSVQSMTL
jgi:hypothetical protein